MPPLKKAIKKAAKKKAGHHDKHHTNDLRRAYEHMGRLEVLGRFSKPPAAEAVDTLTKLAEKEIKSGNNQSAADLLRASEHLTFAALAGDSPLGGRISAELKYSITEHFEELLARADHHWAHRPHATALTTLYNDSRASAITSLKNGALHQALEFARAAEALAHVSQDEQPKLAAKAKNLQLKST